MAEYTIKQTPVLSFEYWQYQKPVMHKLLRTGDLEIPAQEFKEAEAFIEKHGFLTYSQTTEFSTKGRTYVSIYGEWQ